jgi:hypothetical protein
MCILVIQDSVHKLGSRTWIYLTWKIIYAVLPEIEKHFYKKIYIITLCNSWHRSYSWPNTQHIQKLAIEDSWFLRYCRSRVFTFVFFMQKLKGISSGQNNKSCSINHHGSNKICFTFFLILCDFLHNLQDPANLCNYWSYLFANKALGRYGCLQCGPYDGRPARALQFRRGRRPWPGGNGPGRI